MINQLELSKYSNKIKDALQIYVRALDEKDSNIAFIKLWSALEYLTSPGNANYKLITRRCSFLYKEHEYHKQVLEHLRINRNQFVHDGESSTKSKKYCYQLQGYFKTLIDFHLAWTGDLKNLDEANQFLDHQPNLKDLERDKKLIEYAIKFRTG